MAGPRRTVVTLADGTMVFDLPDPVRVAQHTERKRDHIKEEAAKRPKLSVAASPLSSVHKPATNIKKKPWKKVENGEPGPHL